MSTTIVTAIIAIMTAMGARIDRVKTFEEDFRAFINTCLAMGTLERDEHSYKGRRLDEFLLNDKFKGFVLPRGVYLSEIFGSTNYLVAPKFADGTRFMEPEEFKTFQGMVLSFLRVNVVEFQTNLDEASKPLTLVEAGPRSYNPDELNEVHYSDIAFMPLPLCTSVYEDFMYNYEVDKMVKRVAEDIIRGAANRG